MLKKIIAAVFTSCAFLLAVDGLEPQNGAEIRVEPVARPVTPPNNPALEARFRRCPGAPLRPSKPARPIENQDLVERLLNFDE